MDRSQFRTSKSQRRTAANSIDNALRRTIAPSSRVAEVRYVGHRSSSRPILRSAPRGDTRTIGQGHVPFIAIPTVTLAFPPPLPRRAPGAGTHLDSPTVHAAAIDRHARRLAVGDTHTRRNGMTEATQGDLHARRRDCGRSSPGETFASTGANGVIANAPGAHESTSAGDPQRVSPINACSRAMSVEICSGDGSGRVISENWTMRAGVGSTATTTRSMGAGGRMRFEIEQRQRAQRPCVADRCRQL